jgi:hypothetical protein
MAGRAASTATGVAAGAGTGAASGAGIGFLAAGPVGAAVGAGIGGLVGGIGGGVAGYNAGADISTGGSVSRSAQQQALGQLGMGVQSGRESVLGAYDDAIRAQQAANQQAIQQMRMGIAAPAAGTLVGSGAAGLLGSGAAQAGGRQAALTAGMERERMMNASAQAEANILRQQAAQQLGFAEQDLQAAQQRMQGITDSIEQAKKTYLTKGSYVAWLEQQRGAYSPGTAEYEAFNNEIILQEPNIFFSS